MPARDVLDIVCDNASVSYKVAGNTLKIFASVTKVFKLPYVNMATTQKSEIGGDVFGSAASTLKGDYSLKYENSPAVYNVQKQIIDSLYSVLFPPKPLDEEGQPQEGEAETSGSGDEDKKYSGYFEGQRGFAFNRFTGILRVTTTADKMKMIEEYINSVLVEINKQVLIEAKLVEVILNDSSAYGINWRGSIDGNKGGSLSLGTAGGSSFLGGGLTPVGIIANSAVDKWFAFMATFGRVESMGNPPRIRVMNGQSAMISSGQLLPFGRWRKKQIKILMKQQ